MDGYGVIIDVYRMGGNERSGGYGFCSPRKYYESLEPRPSTLRRVRRLSPLLAPRNLSNVCALDQKRAGEPEERRGGRTQSFS